MMVENSKYASYNHVMKIINTKHMNFKQCDQNQIISEDGQNISCHFWIQTASVIIKIMVKNGISGIVGTLISSDGV